VTINTADVARLRLQNQAVASTQFENPVDVVRWLGAVQAQDYLGSLWALGLRLRRATEASVERAVAARSIVRTWPLRGTLHFVAAEDVRWMLMLSCERTVARAASRYRQLGLDEATFSKSRRVLARALEGGRQLTRAELASALERRGISTEGQRLIHILNRSSLEGLTCYAARRGKQFTFALLDEWSPSGKRLTREEALAELAARYFESRGPATLQDFVWWSGLTTEDAKRGMAQVGTPRPKQSSPNSAHLLPAFDEYFVAYKDRQIAAGSLSTWDVLGPTFVIDGIAAGKWKRTNSGKIELSASRSLKKSEQAALTEATDLFRRYLATQIEK